VVSASSDVLSEDDEVEIDEDEDPDSDSDEASDTSSDEAFDDASDVSIMVDEPFVASTSGASEKQPPSRANGMRRFIDDPWRVCPQLSPRDL
jgi:hypothetical protein